MWRCWHRRAQLTGVKSVNDNVICNGPLNLIRVPPSMLGCATINKQPVLLDAGMHFLYSNGFQWLGTRDVTASIIENGPIKIIRVMPGYLGLATSAKKPVSEPPPRPSPATTIATPPSLPSPPSRHRHHGHHRPSPRR